MIFDTRCSRPDRSTTSTRATAGHRSSSAYDGARTTAPSWKRAGSRRRTDPGARGAGRPRPRRSDRDGAPAGTALAMPATTPSIRPHADARTDRARAVLRDRAVALDAQHARRAAAQREGADRAPRTGRRSRVSTAPANSARSTATSIRAPAISASAWPSAASRRGTRWRRKAGNSATPDSSGSRLKEIPDYRRLRRFSSAWSSRWKKGCRAPPERKSKRTAAVRSTILPDRHRPAPFFLRRLAAIKFIAARNRIK